MPLIIMPNYNNQKGPRAERTTAFLTGLLIEKNRVFMGPITRSPSSRLTGEIVHMVSYNNPVPALSKIPDLVGLGLFHTGLRVFVLLFSGLLTS